MLRPTQVPTRSGLGCRVRGPHPLWPAVPDGSAILSPLFAAGPITPARASPRRRFGLFPVRSPLLGESFLLSLPAGTKMFQFPAFAPPRSGGDGIAPAGLPHSDIRGSTGICPSPRLFAACHVLLRLREPRHPPCALPHSVFSFLRSAEGLMLITASGFTLRRRLCRSLSFLLSFLMRLPFRESRTVKSFRFVSLVSSRWIIFQDDPRFHTCQCPLSK